MTFGVLAVLGGIALVGYARQLSHKVSDVRHEVGVAADRVGQIRTLLAGVELPAIKRG